MATDSLEVRIAHLEGAYEQIDKRLTALEGSVTDLRSEIRSEMKDLRTELVQKIDAVSTVLTQKIDSLNTQLLASLRWGTGLLLLSWLTLMVAILLRR